MRTTKVDGRIILPWALAELRRRGKSRHWLWLQVRGDAAGGYAVSRDMIARWLRGEKHLGEVNIERVMAALGARLNAGAGTAGRSEP